MYYEVEFGNDPLLSTFNLGPIGHFHLRRSTRPRAGERLEGIHNFPPAPANKFIYIVYVTLEGAAPSFHVVKTRTLGGAQNLTPTHTTFVFPFPLRFTLCTVFHSWFANLSIN